MHVRNTLCDMYMCLMMFMNIMYIFICDYKYMHNVHIRMYVCIYIYIYKLIAVLRMLIGENSES